MLSMLAMRTGVRYRNGMRGTFSDSPASAVPRFER
jgi:hypothetical protein